MPLRLLPDVERAVVQFLRASSDVSALVSQRVSTELPGSPTYPYVTVRLITGAEIIREHFDAQQIQVDCWADSKASAALLARTVRAAVLTMRSATHDQSVVTQVVTLTTPSWLPDTEVTPPRPRYTFDVQVFIHIKP